MDECIAPSNKGRRGDTDRILLKVQGEGVRMLLYFTQHSLLSTVFFKEIQSCVHLQIQAYDQQQWIEKSVATASNTLSINGW